MKHETDGSANVRLNARLGVIAEASAELSCAWTEHEDGYWETKCDGMFVINEGTPLLNGMVFCCYCGKPIEQVDYDFDDA